VRDPDLFVGRYELVRLVGTGGMGEVHEAIDRETGRRVAVKRLKLGAKPELVARFGREILATAKITSRHVVAVHDAGTDDATGEPFMVMDYLEGEDLERLTIRLGTLSVDLAVRLAAQTCEGLVASHAAQIVHRDIKPANLFLVAPTANASRIVRILDFGVARVHDRDRDLTDLTQTGALVGSPRYMAPEQLYGTRTLDHRADVWSLGVVLYRMLCGTTPHGNPESLAELVVAICSSPAPPLRARAPWVPRELADLVHRALQIEVDARLPSARAFADELRRWLPAGSEITDAMVVAYDPDAAYQPVDDERDPSALSASVVPGARGAARPSIQPATTPAPVAIAAPTPARAPVRAGYVLALFAVVGIAAGAVVIRRSLAQHEAELPPRAVPDAAVAVADGLSPELAATDGGRWFRANRVHCNSVEAGAILRDTPPPAGTHGAAFAIACLALAGDLTRARAMVEALPAQQRGDGVRPTFELVHALADKRDDDHGITEAMRFVVEYAPDNDLALYHVGLSEFLTADLRAHDRLTRFLELHRTDDGFAGAARAMLVDLAKPSHGCTVLAVDPEGTTIHGLDCH